MKLQPLLSVEVEPLGEARWARVERDLFAKLDEVEAVEAHDLQKPARLHPALRWAAGGAAVAAAAAAVFAFAPRWRHALVREDRVILATTDSASRVTVGESSLTLAPRSLMLVHGDDAQGIDVVLDRGRVTCEVAPRHGRPPFLLDSGEVRVRVVGTKFTVERQDAATSVDVEEGAVEVTARGVVTVLHGGEHWPAPASSVTGAPHPLPSGALGPVPTQSPPAPVRAPQRRHGPTSTAAGQDDDLDTVDDEPALPEPTATSTKSEVSAAASDPAGQKAFEAAERIESADPAAAAKALRQLAKSESPWAAYALFELARLEADRGHRGAAIGLVNLYLNRYPHGFHAKDARDLLERMR